MMAWCRLWNEFATDPKWQGIARDARARLPWWRRRFSRLRPTDVKSLWTSLMAFANQSAAGDEGSIVGFSISDWAASDHVPQDEARAIYAELEHRKMIADGMLTAWKRRNPAREDPTSTERGRRFRENKKAKTTGAPSPAKPALQLVSSKPNVFCDSRDETHMKRGETHRNAPDSEGDTESLPTSPAVAVKASSEKLDEGKDGTRAIARAGSAILEIERKKLAHDRVTQRVITEAARTMRTDKYEEFALALCEERPPRWACSERDRIWRQIKRERNAHGAAHVA
jgi:hypothetical protein